MKRRSKKPKQKSPAFDVHAAARKIVPQVFNAMAKAARSPEASVAAQKARELILELGQAPEQNYVIDLKFIEIALNDSGTSAHIVREIPREELEKAGAPTGTAQEPAAS